MEVKEHFKATNILQCGQCGVRNFCQIPEKNIDSHLCDYEIDTMNRFWEWINKTYELDENHPLLNLLIAEILVDERTRRDLKCKGLREDVLVQDEASGKFISITKENLLKQGMHLPISRIIRILKEMKLTPKEKLPKEATINVKHMIEYVAKEAQKYELVDEITRKRKKAIEIE